MKKICLLFLPLLCSCIYAGDNGFWENRKDLFTYLNGYKIDFYDQTDPQIVKSEFSTEKNYKLNEAMTAYKGYTVVNNKIYRKDYFSQSYVRPTKTVTLHGASASQKYEADKRYELSGSINIDGKTYRMVNTDLKGFVALIDPQGKFYSKMGQIKGDNLVLLDSHFYVSPEGARMVDVNLSKSIQTKPVEGFDLKYDGVRLDRIWFLYLDYNGSDGEAGRFKSISFPNKPGLIKINNMAFRVLKSDEDKVDFMVLEDKES